MKASKVSVPRNLSSQVFQYLVDYIRKRRLTSGAEMPSEIRLSADLRVSRGSIREAYRSLESAGILDIANGRSPRVGRLSNRAVTQFLQHALSTEQASQEQVFDLRSSIEVRAAELAADKRTDQDAEALRKEADAMRAAWRRRERFVNADMRFHETLGRATGNPLFALLASALRQSLELSIRAGFDSRRTRAELHRVADIHRAIADAIVARDAETARRVMTVHFDEARAFVIGRSARRSTRRRRAAS
jgi:GntR family transcriptional repressor for pyruvate dehydrogenase complex